MRNSKQSSVELLQECLSIHFTHEQQMQFNGLFEQAKTMHKKEIKNAYKQGVVDEYGDTLDSRTITEAEDYYNDIFNTKEK